MSTEPQPTDAPEAAVPAEVLANAEAAPEASTEPSSEQAPAPAAAGEPITPRLDPVRKAPILSTPPRRSLHHRTLATANHTRPAGPALVPAASGDEVEFFN